MTSKRKLRVVYLFGAGATQAELDFKGANINILMKRNTTLQQDGVCARVMERTKTKGASLNWLHKIKQETRHIDIEQIIGQLEETNLKEHNRNAEILRELYCQDIVENLKKTKVLQDPTLVKALFEIHKELLSDNEELQGVISLNHDNLVEIASVNVFKQLNLGFKFKSVDLPKNSSEPPLIVKLHGSFNWRSGYPIKIVSDHEKGQKSRLWVPPTVFKELGNFPFNKLLGLSYELLLNCDILRVVGCSLSQNDWRIISLIFNAQRARWEHCFEIQLIMTNNTGIRIKSDLGYLKKIMTFGELGPSFAHFMSGSAEEPRKHYSSFEIFLREKIQDYLKTSGKDESSFEHIDNIRKIIQKGR